ncbi:MAG TPA: FAD-dependent monooxygenase [Polyangiales bacterium]|nr:FAD-dependent monooxygenase [Polyangiales bacterium]
MATSASKHAVVLGGSMAGLLAANVLARHFERVTLFERDTFPAGAEPRKGVPQSWQLHGLLAGGRRALEALFPDFGAELLARGAHDVDVGTCGKFLVAGTPLPHHETGLRCFVMSRPLLESYVRERVLAASNIQVRQACVAQNLVGDRHAVTGVMIRDASSQQQELVRTDLVVDATGRGSRLPEWLSELGAQAPEEERVTVNLHYTSFYIRRDRQHLGGDNIWIDNPHPSSRRAGAALAVEGDRFVVGLTGYLNEPMPQDYAAAIDFTKTLRGSALHDLLRSSEPVSELRTMRFAASQRRRYERLTAAPQGLLVAGDALCCFNSVYGQGMTVAALEASALDACLRAGTDDLFKRYQRAAAKLVDVPWSIVVGGDYAFEGVVGKRTLTTRAMNAFMNKLTQAAPHDPEISRAFMNVMHLCAPPSSLFVPNILWRIFSSQTSPRLHAISASREAHASRSANSAH